MTEIDLEEALLRIDALKAKNYEAYRMVEIAKQMMYERGDAVDRVRKLHHTRNVSDNINPDFKCAECWMPYPCRTILKLDGEQ